MVPNLKSQIFILRVDSWPHWPLPLQIVAPICLSCPLPVIGLGITGGTFSRDVVLALSRLTDLKPPRMEFGFMFIHN